jgi:hypothetical protein
VAPFSEGGVAASTLGRRRTGITHRLPPRPLRPLGARHLSNHELTAKGTYHITMVHQHPDDNTLTPKVR